MSQLFTSVDNDELINILNGGGIGVLHGPLIQQQSKKCMTPRNALANQER